MGTDLEDPRTDRGALDPVALTAITRQYGISPAQLQPMRGGHVASVFEYDAGGRACILRVLPPGSDSAPAAVRAVMEWLAFATAHDGPVPRVIHSRAGHVIEVVAVDGREYIASAFEKAPGVLAEGMRLEDWNDELFEALGATLGRYHSIARDYIPRDASLTRPQWDAGPSYFNPLGNPTDIDPLILDRRDQALAAIRSLPKDRDSYGLAHLDLHFGNFYIDSERRRITLLDFDDCAYGWYSMDIAMLLFDVLVVYSGVDRQAFGERFLKYLLRGYRVHMPFSRFWIDQLPALLKLLEIGIYLELYPIYDSAKAGWWDSRFMPGRKERILAHTPYLDLDGAAVAQFALDSSA